MAEFETIRSVTRDGMAIITLARPDKHNAARRAVRACSRRGTACSPDLGGLYHLTGLIGPARAKELA